MEKYLKPGKIDKIIKNTWKFAENTWKNPGILSIRKCGNPDEGWER